MREAGVELPLMVSITIEPMGTMLAGQGVEALYVALEHLDLFSIGLNCATGPEFMTDHLRSLARNVDPIRERLSERGPARRARAVRRDAGEPRVQDDAIRRRGLGELRRRLLRHDAGAHPRADRRWRAAAPRACRRRGAQAVSGIEVFYPADDNRPLFVGERTNVIGSRRVQGS